MKSVQDPGRFEDPGVTCVFRLSLPLYCSGRLRHHRRHHAAATLAAPHLVVLLCQTCTPVPHHLEATGTSKCFYGCRGTQRRCWGTLRGCGGTLREGGGTLREGEKTLRDFWETLQGCRVEGNTAGMMENAARKREDTAADAAPIMMPAWG